MSSIAIGFIVSAVRSTQAFVSCRADLVADKPAMGTLNTRMSILVIRMLPIRQSSQMSSSFLLEPRFGLSIGYPLGLDLACVDPGVPG